MTSAVGCWGDFVGILEVRRKRELMDFGEGGWEWLEWLALERRRDIRFSEQGSLGVSWLCLEMKRQRVLF